LSVLNQNQSITSSYTYSYRDGGKILSELKKLLCGKYVLRGDTFNVSNMYHIKHSSYLVDELHLNDVAFNCVMIKLLGKTGVIVPVSSFSNMSDVPDVRDVKDLYKKVILAAKEQNII
jgi:hypothetical protein